MGKPKQRIVLSDYKAKAKDRGVDIEGEDGKIYSVPPPELWPDHVFTLLAAEDIIGAAQAILGNDEYAAFVAAGGSAMAMIAIAKEAAGADLGE